MLKRTIVFKIKDKPLRRNEGVYMLILCPIQNFVVFILRHQFLLLLLHILQPYYRIQDPFRNHFDSE